MGGRGACSPNFTSQKLHTLKFWFQVAGIIPEFRLPVCVCVWVGVVVCEATCVHVHASYMLLCCHFRL